MKGYTGNAQSMTDVAAIIEQARAEGLDLPTALLIARTTLVYVSGSRPDADQIEALETLDRHLLNFQLQDSSSTSHLMR